LAAADRDAAAPAPSGFEWTWALLTIPIVIGVTLALLIAAGVAMCTMGVDAADETRQTTVGFLVIVAGMLLGGMLAGWLSPGRTVLEPGVASLPRSRARTSRWE
jgi:hypothetical protein